MKAFADEATDGLVTGERSVEGLSQDDRFRGRLDFWKMFSEQVAEAGGFEDLRGLTRWMEDRS